MKCLVITQPTNYLTTTTNTTIIVNKDAAMEQAKSFSKPTIITFRSYTYMEMVASLS